MLNALKPVIRSCKRIPLGESKIVKHNLNSRLVSQIAPEEIAPALEKSIRDDISGSAIPYEEGFTCYQINDCTLCSPLVKKSTLVKLTDLYVNKKTGYFLCERCKCAGNWTIFHKLLSKGREEKQAKEVSLLKEGCIRYDKVSQGWKETTDKSDMLSKLNDEEYSSNLASFKLMQCSKSVAEKLQIRISLDRNQLYFPMFSTGNIVVGYTTLDKSGNCTTLPRTECPGFVSYSLSKKKSSSALVVSNLVDFFSLLDQNLPVQVICLPYGGTHLPQSMLPFLESYNKITLWLGIDSGAWHSLMNFSQKLNEKRCNVIRPTKNQISPKVAVDNKENIAKILAEAKPAYHEAITNFSALKEEVLAEVQNTNEVLGVAWTRFPTLNKILKGHRRGELTVITGPTGSGKTTFMSEYSLDLAMQGVNTLWGSFEIRNARLARMMLQQYAGVPLTAENINQVHFWADKFEKLPIYFMTFHGQEKISNVMDAVEYSTYAYDIGHVIIDNVQFMIDISLEAGSIDRFWKQDCIIQSFRTFATKFNCHVTLVIHPRKGVDGMDLSMNSIFGGAKAAQEADNVLIIQDKRLESFKGKKYLQICKNRYAGDLGIMPLEFDKTRLCFSKK